MYNNLYLQDPTEKRFGGYLAKYHNNSDKVGGTH